MAEALGVAGSAVGVISLGIQVCQGLLAYYDSWKGCHQDIADTLRSVASLDKTLKYLREIVEDQIKPGESIEQQIGDIVAQCAAGIQALEGELGKFKKYTESADIRAKFNSHLRRLQYPFKEDTLAKLRQSVQDVRDSLVPALGILQIKKLSSIEEQTRNMTISLASSENFQLRDDIRRWLSAPDPSVNQNAAAKKCQKDTGIWLLNHPKFLYWRGLPDSFLWLHGFAGCGKTVLCSTVIHNVSKHTASLPRSAFAFYYFDFTNDVKTKSLSCLRSIILQLVEQTADTASLEALQRTYASGTPPPQELLQVLKGMLCKCNRAYIVVDALDECTDQDELFELLDSIRDWKLECLSLLVTSRDEPDIRECVDPTAEQEMLLENSAIDSDIRSFIVETLQKNKKLQAWSELFPEIEDALANGAQGMFRWVDCQIQALRHCHSRAELRKALKDLPETLDKTYERILRNIRPKSRDNALRLLQWLCIADEPIDLQHVMESFGVDLGQKPHFNHDAQFVTAEKVLALCPGLIIKVEHYSKDCVQIAHYSVKEYLVSSRLPAAPDPLCMFRVQEPLANLTMAKICLVYVISIAHKTDDNSSEFGLKFKPSFVDIIRWQWPKFYRHAGKTPYLTELAISYLTSKNGHTLDGDINAAMDFVIARGFHDLETCLLDNYGPSSDPGLVLLAKCNLDVIKSLDFVRFWVEKGADVNARSVYERWPYLLSQGSTPLHFAALSGNVALAKILLQCDANLEATNDDGETPLTALLHRQSVAQGCPKPEMVQLLWFDGAQDILDQKKQNLLHLIAKFRIYSGSDDGRIEFLVPWFINHAVDPYSKDTDGYTPLHRAAFCNNIVAIKALIATTERSSEYGGCLVAYLEGAYLGHELSTAQLLFDFGPDPLLRFNEDSSFLTHMILSRRATVGVGDRLKRASRVVAFFLQYEEDPRQTRLDLYISLIGRLLKTKDSDAEIMSWLVAQLVKRTDLDFVGAEIWGAALSELCVIPSHGEENETRENVVLERFRLISKLFERRDIFGVGTKAIYRFLLQNAFDRGPFAELIMSQEPAYADLGLSDDIRSVVGSNDYYSGAPEFASLMLHREIHPDTQDEVCDAALMDAILHGSLEMTRLLMERLLLKRACDINHQTRDGLTLLAGAVYYLDDFPSTDIIEIVKILINAGCDGNLQDNAGRTPMMIAALRGQPLFVELLLQEGCNADLQDREGGTSGTEVVSFGLDHLRRGRWTQRFVPIGGYTALMYAVIMKRTKTVKLLLANGCNASLQNNQGRTALDLARQFGEDEIIEILQNHENEWKSEISELED